MFSAIDFCRDVKVELSLAEISTEYRICGSIEGQVNGIQSINCSKSTSARFVKVSSTADRFDVHEIEVIGRKSCQN